MSQFLFYYVRPEPQTWVFLSSFLVVGLFVMFHRFWSMRNLDILLILAFTPGLMMYYEGRILAIKQQTAAKSAAATEANSPQANAAPDNVSPPNTAPGSAVAQGPGAAGSGGTPPVNTPQSNFAATDKLESAKLDSAVPPAGSALADQGLTPPDNATRSDNTESGPTEVAALPPVPTPPKTNWPSERLLYWGFLWLLICAGLLVIRMLLDTAIVRRPLLDPNLSSGGMLFLGASLLLFLLANVVTSTPEENRKQGPGLGPHYVLLSALPQITTTPILSKDTETASGAAITNAVKSTVKPSDKPTRASFRDAVARALAIGANLALVFSIIAIGYWHFGNLKTGVGAATLYLLLPYTAHMTGQVDHVVPGALMLLAILLYRQPFVAGMFLGAAAGVVYYPFSLLPLWCSFYWQRGIRRFTMGFALSVTALVLAIIILRPSNMGQDLGYMFGIKPIAMNGMDGIWGLGWHPFIRIPIIVVFVLLSWSFVLWPAQKNLATLMSCSSAIMAATQFWNGFGGGLYMAWFVPIALLTIFRPNLDYCIALEVVRPMSKKPKAVKSDKEDQTPLAAAG